MLGQRGQEIAQARHTAQRAVEQLARHVLELHARHGRVHVARDLARHARQARTLLGRRRLARQQAVDRFLARVDHVVDRHEAVRQLLDGFLEQQRRLHEVGLDFGQVAPAMVGYTRQEALDV